MECENCGQSLDRGVLVLPWEDGNNPLAYVRCPYRQNAASAPGRAWNGAENGVW